ncbi:hypothetical protein [Chryseobacterium sp. OSA05B]|uniref:hypothetical protein n=1 Tax=Chryseobacterium sp. OSA05B TaxID=2862650 RepID=UPI001CC0967A|nr:hypothetical protein [Chryseobacterium sp. OSA05B]
MLHEILKHLKKGGHSLINSELNVINRLGEFIVEIFAIVIAVTISIWFHNINENRHKKAEIHEYLEQINEDLSKDMYRIDYCINGLYDQRNTYNLFLKNNDSLIQKININKISRVIFDFHPNTGSYESIIYGGKTNYIKDIILRRLLFEYYIDKINLISSISNLYEKNNDEIFHDLTYREDFYSKNKNLFLRKIDNNKSLIENNFLPELKLTKNKVKEIQDRIRKYNN